MTVAFHCQATRTSEKRGKILSKNNHNIYTLFASRFPAHLTEDFIENETGTCWSYEDMERQSARYACFLTSLGVKPGNRVAVQVDKSPEAVFLYLGCLRAGFIYLPLNTAYLENEVDYFLENAKPAVVVCRPEAREMTDRLALARDVPHVFSMNQDGGGDLAGQASQVVADFTAVDSAEDDVAVILHTSGTTGHPKGAMITHGNLADNSQVLHQAWGWQSGDILLHSLPIFHIHGLFVACHCVLLNGSKMIFIRKFDVATVIRMLPRATVFMGVPTFYTRLLANPDFGAEQCCNMRLFTSGSAPLLEQTFDEFHQRTGHIILERYDMTETGMNTSNPLEGERIVTTVGPPLPGVAVRVVDDQGETLVVNAVGQLEVKGKNVFKGYWRMPEKTAEEFTTDGYFKTGDMAKIDNRGYVSIIGRTKDLIITGGLNVYPDEIESLIDDMEGVVESAVIGVPHVDFGEAVTAVVIRQVGSDSLSEQAIIDYLRQQMANFKVPKHVHFVESLPRYTMGKVQKNILRKQFG
jgi:malonyl-CoA/methylmalonyl-CoA synthetase